MVIAQGVLIAGAGAGAVLGVGISLAAARAMQALLVEARAAAPSTLLIAVARCWPLPSRPRYNRPGRLPQRMMRTLTTDR